MSGELKGRKIPILATDGFEQVELTEPKKNVENAGATTEVLRGTQLLCRRLPLTRTIAPTP